MTTTPFHRAVTGLLTWLLFAALLAALSAPLTARAELDIGNGGDGDIGNDDVRMYQGGQRSGGLFGLFGGGGGGNDLLSPERAFPFAAELVAEDVIVARWNTADKYYLYRDRLSFELEGAEIAGYELPAGKMKDDPNFGVMEVYYGTLEVYIRLTEPATSDLMLTVGFQGCADSGVCYPPMTNSFDMAAGSGSSGLGGGLGGGPAAGGSGGASGLPLQAGAQLATLLSGGNLPLILGGFFAAGLLLAFTACLYPMIPILSGIIAGDKRRGSGRAFLLSLVFVQATAVTYALAGAAAGLSGSAIQADLQGPWVLGSFAAVFVLLALAMFGAYSLQMPAVIQTRLDNLARRQRGGTFIGAAIMGALSALIVGACAGPALIAALVFISNTGDAWLGGMALFAMANGMGLPLLVLGTAAGRWLPGSGPWMITVRRVFGVVFLGVAIWMLDRFLPGPVTLALWAALLIGTAVWLGSALQATESSLAAGGRRFTAAILVIWGGVLLLGAAAGGNSFWQPLQPLVNAGGGGQPEPVEWQKVGSVDALGTALDQARAEGRTVVLDVYADWCIYCVQLERNTFPDPRVREVMANSLMLKVDVTAMNSADRALLEHLNVFLPPAVIFYDIRGEERTDYRVVGFMSPEDFSRQARHALHPEAY